MSEDATCKLWNKSGDCDKTFDTLKGHTGLNVRAVASLYDDA